MGANPKQNITKLETNYALKKEESQISIARRKKGLYRRLAVFFVLAVAVVIFNGLDTHFTKLSFSE